MAQQDLSTAPTIWAKLTSMSFSQDNISLTHRNSVIGKSQQASVRIDDPRISDFHCTIFYEDDGSSYLIDTSKGGTYLGKVPVCPGKKINLEIGDKVFLLDPVKINPLDNIGFIFSVIPNEINKLKIGRFEIDEPKQKPSSPKVKKVESQEFLDELQCTICMDYLHQCVSILPCMHNYCGGCLSDWIYKEHKKICPNCRAKIDEVKINTSVNNIVTKYIEVNFNGVQDQDTIKKKELNNRFKEKDKKNGKFEIPSGEHRHILDLELDELMHFRDPHPSSLIGSFRSHYDTIFGSLGRTYSRIIGSLSSHQNPTIPPQNPIQPIQPAQISSIFNQPPRLLYQNPSSPGHRNFSYSNVRVERISRENRDNAPLNPYQSIFSNFPSYEVWDGDWETGDMIPASRQGDIYPPNNSSLTNNLPISNPIVLPNLISNPLSTYTNIQRNLPSQVAQVIELSDDEDGPRQSHQSPDDFEDFAELDAVSPPSIRTVDYPEGTYDELNLDEVDDHVDDTVRNVMLRLFETIGENRGVNDSDHPEELDDE